MTRANRSRHSLSKEQVAPFALFKGATIKSEIVNSQPCFQGTISREMSHYKILKKSEKSETILLIHNMYSKGPVNENSL